jgi:hypothetical protein
LNSFGIAKILDYGRSFFNDKNEKVSSKTLLSIVEDSKKTPNCFPGGVRSGYSYLNDEVPKGSHSYIVSNKKNITHDLRLAKIVNSYLNYNMIGDQDATGKVVQRTKEIEPIKKILQSVNKNYQNLYSLKREKIDRGYGAPEYAKQEYQITKQVRNVKDMHVALKDLILTQPYFKDKMMALFMRKKKIGTLHIYVDGSKPTEYIAVA